MYAADVDMRDIETAYRRWSLADYPAGLQEAVAPFLRGENWSVYLTGAVGTGKTCLAAAILRHARQCGLAHFAGGYGAFVDPAAFARWSRDFETGQRHVDAWHNHDCLLIDDIGSLRSTPHLTEQFLMLFSTRYNRRRPTIVTSNLTLPQLGQALDARIASRLQEGIIIDLGDTDLRAGQPDAQDLANSRPQAATQPQEIPFA